MVYASNRAALRVYFALCRGLDRAGDLQLPDSSDRPGEAVVSNTADFLDFGILDVDSWFYFRCS